MKSRLHIGMRKIKSILAVSISFLIWQGIRIFLPMLEAHPIFAYIYSIIEMREIPEKTKNFGKLRIRATIIGLVIGLVFVTLSVYCSSKVTVEIWRIFVEFLFILVATLCSLCIAELFKCKNFCGIAAIITVICMVSHSGEDVYLYAVMRTIQTLIGVFSATIINVFVRKKSENQDAA